MRRHRPALALLALSLAIHAGGQEIRFTDLAPEAGLDRLRWSGRLRDARIIGTVGGGAAWGDWDGDGDPDLVVTDGISRPRRPRHPDNCARLLRNDGGHFVDVTSGAGLAACGWGMGALWEDLDEDGHLDLVLTFVGRADWWRGDGAGGFELARGAGLPDDGGWYTGAAALDTDGDGALDLYLARYLDTTPEREAKRPIYQVVPIDAYDPQEDVLLVRAEGRFQPSPWEGAAPPPGRALGVLAADLDRDGRSDLYVANDRDRNTLLQGTGRGLRDVTDLAGVGLGLDGRAESGMGVATGDVDGNGWPDLLVTNYAREPVNLYLGLGDLVFVDRAREAGVAAATWDHLGWAGGLADLDLDGAADAWVANGHLMPQWFLRLARRLGPDPAAAANFVGSYRQPLLLFRGDGAGGYTSLRHPFPPGVWRGGGEVDVDGDGRVDVFLYSSARGVPSRLLRNVSEPGGGWLRLVLRRPGAPPAVAGTAVRVAAPGREWHLQVVSGGSYLSGSALPLHVGTGDAPVVSVEIGARPGHARRRHQRLPTGRTYAF